VTCRLPPSALQASLTCGSTEVAVHCVPSHGGCYQCSYTPPAAGQYVLEVTSGGRHLRGSPFAVQVRVRGHVCLNLSPCMLAMLPYQWHIQLAAGSQPGKPCLACLADPAGSLHDRYLLCS
jgi:hypothetical protein